MNVHIPSDRLECLIQDLRRYRSELQSDIAADEHLINHGGLTDLGKRVTIVRQTANKAAESRIADILGDEDDV